MAELFIFSQQSEQYVLSLDRLGPKLTCFISGEEYDAARLLSIPFEHICFRNAKRGPKPGSLLCLRLAAALFRRCFVSLRVVSPLRWRSTAMVLSQPSGQPPVFEVKHPIADCREPFVMSDDYRRQRLRPMNLLEERVNALAGLGVEVAGRFIQKQQSG